ncbi:MAG: CBS domain-containing protein [Leptolyngbyaceae cyanobacterium MAG.088]|nr:CBS domain-containing protein [Leptolyngbyaceae cyanobacterium MAG.088]
MDLILCHTTADFDTLGAAIGLACLHPGSRIVLTDGSHPAIKSFLALHRDEYPLIEKRAVTVSMIRSITVVDAHERNRIGMAAAWIEHAISTQLPITIYDRHTGSCPDIPGEHHIEAVGATTTLVVEALQTADQQLSSAQATAMALGIHSVTGSLSCAHTTPRDVKALAWLMEQGANQQTFAEAIALGTNQSATAQDVMSSPVRTIRPDTTVADAQRILLRYGHSGLCVTNDMGQLQGIISRRDIDLALHHGFSHAPVNGHMTRQLKTIKPDTPLNQIQALMVTHDLGRLPVLDSHKLVGIVTRTDVLRQIYSSQAVHDASLRLAQTDVYQRLQTSLQAYSTALESGDLWTLLTHIALAAEQRGWHLYLVGGAVRDLLLAPMDTTVSIKDIDLVVDSFRSPVMEGAGVVLAQQLQTQYPDAELQVHGDFQTAALIWRTRTGHAPLMLDIATARTEFYPYPAANPEVEPSSIRQDLYRRDFTINAMAIRLTSPQPGLLLDFFGGHLDLQNHLVRVLHANSFIEDPTRIFRAVRFAVRLGFTIDSQTETFIRYAVDSGIYTDLQTQQKRLPALQTRLKAELTYMFQANYWAQALRLLDKLGALSCLHPTLTIDVELWLQLHRVSRWQQRFVKEVGKAIDVEPWLMRLEILLARVEERSQIATNLQLPIGSIQRLQQLPTVEEDLLKRFQHTKSPQPSFIYQTLVAYNVPSLLLVSVRHPKKIGTYIWQYVTQLIHTRSPINGNHLKQLGYPPGPLYRQILTDLTHAALDGEITSLASAKTYLTHRYPIENIQ